MKTDYFKIPYKKEDSNTALIKFAEEFSYKCKILPAGNYRSECGKFNIEYIDGLKDDLTNESLATLCRIGHKSKIIQLDRAKVINDGYISDFVFFMVIWCYIRLKLRSEMDADAATMKIYRKTGRSIKNIRQGFLIQFAASPTDLNKKRFVAMFGK